MRDIPEPIMRFFRRQKLPPLVQPFFEAYEDVAEWIMSTAPRGPERAGALRRLLESRDALLRAVMAELIEREAARRAAGSAIGCTTPS